MDAGLLLLLFCTKISVMVMTNYLALVDFVSLRVVYMAWQASCVDRCRGAVICDLMRFHTLVFRMKFGSWLPAFLP